jgi:hypothetical protein
MVNKMESAIRGMRELHLVSIDQQVTISWKQGSFLGAGGDHSEPYSLCKYSKDGDLIPVFIQRGYDIPQVLPVDGRLQWGMNDGNFFFVFHDKSRTPYQHRFVQSAAQNLAIYANEMIKLKTKGFVDASWVVGDYLHNV